MAFTGKSLDISAVREARIYPTANNSRFFLASTETGYWKFRIYVDLNAHVHIGIMLSNTTALTAGYTGYALTIEDTDGTNVDFTLNDNGSPTALTFTLADIIDKEVTVEVTRTAAGLFSVYVDGALGDTVTDLTHTTSTYVGVDWEVAGEYEDTYFQTNRLGSSFLARDASFALVGAVAANTISAVAYNSDEGIKSASPIIFIKPSTEFYSGMYLNDSGNTELSAASDPATALTNAQHITMDEYANFYCLGQLEYQTLKTAYTSNDSVMDSMQNKMDTNLMLSIEGTILSKFSKSDQKDIREGSWTLYVFDGNDIINSGDYTVGDVRMSQILAAGEMLTAIEIYQNVQIKMTQLNEYNNAPRTQFKIDKIVSNETTEAFDMKNILIA